MRLLKIGTLNMPRNRWEDALDIFDDIDVFCFDTEEEIKNDHIHYIKFDTSKMLSFFFYRAARHFNYNRNKILLCKMCLNIIRLLNISLLRRVNRTEYDAVHSSYNDFDESAFLTVLLKPEAYVRAQKETRLYYSFFEKWAFQHASRIVLNDPLNLELFEKKYGQGFVDKKKMVYNIDEDVRTYRLRGNIEYEKKLSNLDNKIHAVILAGRVLSDPSDSRSGGRLYYIDLIKKLLSAGIVVHLHTANIVEHDGNNPYKELASTNRDFIIEDKLDFSKEPEKAYGILSRYDVGICHAHLPNSEVTEFDKVNIPHRYYEYHLAHVAPIDIRGGNLLLEKKMKDNHALIVNSFSELYLDDIRKIDWDTPFFADYINELYGVIK
ncbi:MAG: hypothetical protein GX660_18605 [Clostridiaceae bacterium]|nr:hypothetical protein [Clostridiaceae bacterium]